MQIAEPHAVPDQGYEIVADFHFSGRSFLRGELRNESELAPMKRVLLAAGLFRRAETTSSQ
jgi:hypothetical protein